MQMSDLKVNVDRLELIGKLQENLKNHSNTAEEAQKGWHKTVVEICGKIAKSELKTDVQDHLKELQKHQEPPYSYANYYERAIAMLEMGKDAHIELGSNDFDCFVRDEWDWSMRWAASNRIYYREDKL